MEHTLDKHQIDIIKRILNTYELIRSGIYGSYSNGKATDSSDIDIYIEYKEPLSLFDLVEIKSKLENSLNKKVDLTTQYSINKYLANDIMNNISWL